MHYRTLLTAFTLVLSLAATPALAEDPKNSPDALFIITSDSLQTRGMAMVLANAMSQQGAQLHFLLCDSAGELAVADYESQALEPRGMRPEGLLAQLMKNSAKVEVCALYLPNSQYSAADLREGVTVAQPPEIARMMADENIRVFGF